MASSKPVSVFPPEIVALINRAFAEAVDIIGAEAEQANLRQKLAEHMMFLARNGEDNEQRLCSLAVVAVLGRHPDGRAEGSGARVDYGR